MRARISGAFAAYTFAVVSASIALALPPDYTIVPLGLDDAKDIHRGRSGQLNEAGQAYGVSSRANGLGFGTWYYDGASTIEIGLIGTEHRRSDGLTGSGGILLNEAGHVLGSSDRFNGGSSSLGQSIWLFDGTKTINIGIVDSEHTRSDGYRYSVSNTLNAAGQAIGIADRFDGASIFGRSAWFYNGTMTITLGLAGPDFQNANGIKSSFAVDLNDGGQVLGTSSRYPDLGTSTWIYDGTTTVEIGLLNPEHTRNDNYRSNSPNKLNSVGQALGSALRFDGGSAYLGYTPWYFNGTNTVSIGLTGPEHTRNDGYKEGRGYELNELGHIVGGAMRFNGGNVELGWSAWLYDGAATLDISLVDSEHTRDDGFRSSTSVKMNAIGQVIGRASRHNGTAADLGQSAWFYNGTSTIEIGLGGAEYTRNDGYQYISPTKVNNAGQVLGHSNPGGRNELGNRAWIYDGSATREIGLYGAAYQLLNGGQIVVGEMLNEAGQVAGFSYRRSGGQDAWVYDPMLDQTIPLQLSMRSDGYAFSQVLYLGDDGLALGTYQLYDALDVFLGYRAFSFTLADGTQDLGLLVDGGLAAEGWDFLATALSGNAHGQVFGTGKLTSQSGGQMAFLLTPVPEPATIYLGIFLMLCVFLPRRR